MLSPRLRLQTVKSSSGRVSSDFNALPARVMTSHQVSGSSDHQVWGEYVQKKVGLHFRGFHMLGPLKGMRIAATRSQAATYAMQTSGAVQRRCTDAHDPTVGDQSGCILSAKKDPLQGLQLAQIL